MQSFVRRIIEISVIAVSSNRCLLFDRNNNVITNEEKLVDHNPNEAIRQSPVRAQ